MSLFNRVLYKANKTEVKSFGQIAGQLFVTPWKTKQRKNSILGELLHLVVGSLTGIPLFFVLKKTGKDHYLSKGLAASMLTWSVLFNGGQKVGLFKKLRFTMTHYSSAWSHIIYGLVSSQAIVSLADPTIFASSSEINQETSQPAKKDTYHSNSNSNSNFMGANRDVEQAQPEGIVY